MEATAGFGFISLARGLVGIASVLAISYLLSYDRKRIDWRLVGGGLLIQLVLALSILYVPPVGALVEALGKVFVKLMDFTGDGLDFLLGPYASKAAGFSFLLHSLPIVIFFSALVSLFYYWGIIQKVVGALSWLLRKVMNISGTEGLVACGNIFLGMTESPVLIKNYLPVMNRSELFLVMVSGMGTIAGSVMGSYVGMLGGTDPAAQQLFATHLGDGRAGLDCDCEDDLSTNRTGGGQSGPGMGRRGTYECLRGDFLWNSDGREAHDQYRRDAARLYLAGGDGEFHHLRPHRALYGTE